MSDKLRCPFKRCYRLRFERNTVYLGSHFYVEHTKEELAGLLYAMIEEQENKK